MLAGFLVSSVRGRETQMTSLDVQVGARVRERRTEMGLSSHYLSLLLGITSQKIARYERGEERMPPAVLWRAAKTLAVPLSWFYAG